MGDGHVMGSRKLSREKSMAGTKALGQEGRGKVWLGYGEVAGRAWRVRPHRVLETHSRV